MRKPTDEELAPLIEISEQLEDLHTEQQARLRTLRRACGVPPGASFNMMTCSWVDPRGTPLPGQDA